jgi:glycosyltransferase involved in cell wall biosynthesis
MTAALPHVAVLMAAYNGAEFLPRQLDSLAAQTHENWRLWVSDDGSADATLDILRRYQRAWGADRLRIRSGPGRGFQHNFLSLTASPDLTADYFAWSDQDDIWLPNKLSRAVTCLAPHGQERPALYCGRTILIDRRGRALGRSPLMTRRPPGFANALVQSLAGGNTMVFNRPARDLIAARPDFSVPSHDWWAYQVVSGCGGRVFYDPEPLVRYRQHGANVNGSNRGPGARWSRLKNLFAGTLKQYVEMNLEALKQVLPSLTPGSRRHVENLAELHCSANPVKRLRLFWAGGFHRQFRAEQWALGLAAFMGRV